MSKTIFISNRLPVTIKEKDGNLEYHKSIGGLATGLSSYHENTSSIWVGWTGITEDSLDEQKMREVESVLEEKYKCLPVHMNECDVEQFYYGFCNKTIWPLFHYFINKTEYDEELWTSYEKVNRMFYDRVSSVIEPNDVIWVHDYQLMLLPQMIKENFPNTKIGFFLHIPFPSFEIYRLLVWREQILYGLLGADLIGFHTYDYVRHFLSSVRRLLGYDHNLNRICFEDRLVRVDAFPMGIDYDRFAKDYHTEAYKIEEEKIVSSTKNERIILSIDRLDYTKGIPERIKAFDGFLSQYPEFIGKVRFHLIVAPSRTEVETYENLRSEIAELVSDINGRYSTVDWMPIWFFFQSFSQEQLIALYKHSDVLLVTPLRDGMNLVAKEYIASRVDKKGMMVISETAGAASELGETVVVNANDSHAITEGLKTAFDMTDDEKQTINEILHKRLKRYNVKFWADDFLMALEESTDASQQMVTQSIEYDNNIVIDAYRKAEKRILFLDYDGTLTGFKSIPRQAKPDIELKHLLHQLIKDPKNTVVIVSGRDHYTLQEWLGDLDMPMLAAHGLWKRERNGEWGMMTALDNSWKESIIGIMQTYVDRMPGALIEEKDYSVAFHYRRCEPYVVSVKLGEIRSVLSSAIESMSLGIQEGNRVLEIKDSRIDKGQSAAAFLQNEEYDFILGAGDDYTDENLFKTLPSKAFTIKIGMGKTEAQFCLRSWQSMRKLLTDLIK